LFYYKGSVLFYYNGWKKEGMGYIDEKNIRKNNNLINKYKVLFPKAWGTGNMAVDNLNPFIVDENSCCSETYIVIGTFDNKNTASNAISYIGEVQ